MILIGTFTILIIIILFGEQIISITDLMLITEHITMDIMMDFTMDTTVAVTEITILLINMKRVQTENRGNLQEEIQWDLLLETIELITLEEVVL
jgi:hypothetical protein